MRITVIGGGVIGLSSALALREAGHDVSIIAADVGPAITSYAAGAVWFPFHAAPPERVNRWASVTHEWLARLAREQPVAGVDVLDFFAYVDDAAVPWWAPSIPGHGARLVREGLPGSPDAPRRAAMAWRFAAPRVDPAVFLEWLRGELSRRGVGIEIRRVKSFADVQGDVLVNCTGLGARALTGDSSLRARYGGIVVTEPGGIDMGVSISDDRRAPDIFYSIPRRNEVVLGGSTEDCNDSRATDIAPELLDAILERARLAGLRPGPVIRAYGGLRPFRESVRLERDADDRRVLHNYGHGGAGFTICRGCALEVVSLMDGRA